MAFEGQYSIHLDFPTSSTNEPRWGYGKPTNPHLYDRINRKRSNYSDLLHKFLNYKDTYLSIDRCENPETPKEPHLTTIWLPGLDSLALYSMLAIHNPATYIEVGSGNSTKFARRSIRDHNLRTKLISIDPEPRAEIDSLCDEVVRSPVENVDPQIFEQLETNDILFIDGSHRCFMNSDVTALFLDIIPRLNPGVFIEMHDIWLPDDYPPPWTDRYYSEQYLLAAYILAGGDALEIVLPNCFITHDDSLIHIVDPIFSQVNMEGGRTGGGSFWFRFTEKIGACPT